ncbi:hypothetical protein M9Y10_006641 [Tritrichomonas musculus]|uniref:EF-hand domain-containing protein n=1 Tax=Tritrichomonas musculus TaxID=1915356 RepID=A0ABR2JER7_9EUKA
MSDNKVDVPFSFESFDLHYLESLAVDFNKYDGDNDGRLTKQEFVKWLVNGGTKKKVAKHLFYVADTCKDGTISLDEFRSFAAIQQDMIVKGEVEKYVKLLYNSVKSRSNSPGGLTKKEFLKFMKLMNTPVDFLQRKKVFNKYDTDDNGRVDFNEIMAKVYFRQRKMLDASN